MHLLHRPRIFYAVQATGNGHISRAIQLLPYLQQLGQVDVFLSGANATMDHELPVQYRSKGLSLFYSACGGLSFKRTWTDNSLMRAMKEARQLPVERYDVIINDFDFITAQACRLKGLPSVQFGHQASFMSPHTPRPPKRQHMGEWVLQRYAVATHYVGLHFQPYDAHIFPPVIKQALQQATPTDQGHVSVYLPAYERHCIERHLLHLRDIHFHWFLQGITRPEKLHNITYYPISNELFTQSLLHCHGLITGGGFETPAEALYLGKRLLSIPIRGQYEQQCNAAALQQLGVMVLPEADEMHFASQIKTWLQQPAGSYVQAANDIPATLQHVLQLGRQQRRAA